MNCVGFCECICNSTTLEGASYYCLLAKDLRPKDYIANTTNSTNYVVILASNTNTMMMHQIVLLYSYYTNGWYYS